MVEARNLGFKPIVQAFIRLDSSAKEGEVLSHVAQSVRFCWNKNPLSSIN